MGIRWLCKEERSKLIIFCNGWGMDHSVVSHMTSAEYDVVSLCDYQNIQREQVEKLPAGYDSCSLVSWSMGVWAGQLLFADCADSFAATVAVNGTLCPVDDRFGIPEKIFKNTLDNFNENTRERFCRRMCRDKSNLRYFLSLPLERTLQSQKNELAYWYREKSCEPAERAVYRKIIIADSDFIIPTENQKRFWEGFRIEIISGFHYLFPLFQSWEQLVNYSSPIKFAEYL